MVTVATGAFSWSLTRWVDTQAVHYTVPLVVTATVWILTVVFVSGVCWEVAVQAGSWMAKPSRPPRPTPPPEQPGETPRHPPAPIQPPRPKPNRRVEVTLVDMRPVVDTQEIPVVWTPPVSETSRRVRDR
jgi:hypothetical protein